MNESRLIAIETLTSRANKDSKELLHIMQQLKACYSEKISLENHLKQEKLHHDINLKRAELNIRLGMLFLEISNFLTEEN